MTSGDNQRPSKGSSGAAAWGSVAGLGFEFLLSILLPGALGWWLDKRWETTPWLMLALGAFGFGAGLYRMLKTVNQIMK